MGKTEAGALWLDPKKTSPYDFYQYWRNVDDQDVEKCLALLTFLPMDEVRRLGALQGSEINEAKKVLAYEVTKLVHGEAEAEAAAKAAGALFGGNALDGAVPTTEIESLEGNKRVIDLMVKAGLCKSLGEGRRLIAGGGVYLNDKKVENPDQEVTEEDFGENGLMLRKGKKAHHRILMK